MSSQTGRGATFCRHVRPQRARLRQRLPSHPLPILRLARLGVDRTVPGSGLGRALLKHILALALTQRDELGCNGVVVYAKPGAVPFYERLGFVPLEPVREGHLHGGSTPLFLAIRRVAAALAP